MLTEERVEFPFLAHETDPHTFVSLGRWEAGGFRDLPYIRFGEFSEGEESPL